MRHELFTLGAERFVLDAETLAQVRRLQATNPTAALDLARRHHRQVMPNGGSVRVPLHLADSARLPPNLFSSKDQAMSLTKSVTLADGRVITTDTTAADVIESLAGQNAALAMTLRGRTTGAVNDADQRTQLADAASLAMAAEQRARRAAGTPYGDHVERLRTAHRGPAQQ